MDVDEAAKIVDAIPNHEYIVCHWNIGDPVSKRIVQLDGGFTAEQLHAIATIMERKPNHWE